MAPKKPNGAYTREDQEEAIVDFFNSVPRNVTREACDENARRLIREHRDGPVKPVLRQGRHSYTIFNEVDPSHNYGIIQYRHPESRLDLSMLELAKTAHGKLVPQTSGRTCHLKTPGGNGAHIPWLQRYRIQWMSGSPLDEVLRRRSLHLKQDRSQHMKLMRQLAEYFADALTRGVQHGNEFFSKRTSDLRSAALYGVAYSTQHSPTVDQAVLASRFTHFMNRSAFPQVITHGELADLSNILVDKSTWEIKGIIDWASAFVWPFGFELYVVQRATGYWDHDPLPDDAPDSAPRDKHRVGEYVWRWFPDAHLLKCVFWRHMVRCIDKISYFSNHRNLIWPWRFGLILSEAFERGPGGEITTTPISLNDRDEEKMRSLAMVRIFLEDEDWISHIQSLDQLRVRSTPDVGVPFRYEPVPHGPSAETECSVPIAYYPEDSSQAGNASPTGKAPRNDPSESHSDSDIDVGNESSRSNIKRTLDSFAFPSD